ncbi:hypothetical protein MJO28_010785 [Puccinia striiformis f. sp. tritici]|uniref:Uncharacterized protein n=1 Tax=Puccinia striiformis f. sp. tritici TaxID=168172 RepID=A0ACC0E5G7_9BASI|nr:hypothetical protein MJO28_010785 [Puccinia striiformis f. sp. tritici]
MLLPSQTTTAHICLYTEYSPDQSPSSFLLAFLPDRSLCLSLPTLSTSLYSRIPVVTQYGNQLSLHSSFR